MATVPTPSTQTAGTVVPAATINSQGNLATYLAGRVESGGARKPVALLRQTVAQSLTTGVENLVTFDVEDVDYDGGHSTISNTDRYTAQTAGWYLVSGLVSFSANATGFRFAYYKVNGTSVNSSQVSMPTNSAGVATGLPLAPRLMFLNATDFLQVGAQHNVGVALNTSATASQASQLSVTWVAV